MNCFSHIVQWGMLLFAALTVWGNSFSGDGQRQLQLAWKLVF